LLEYLARNINRVVGRAEISEHVWDESYDPLSNSIDVHINRLRRKVDDGFPSPLIHTRRGAGYILTSDATLKIPASGMTMFESMRARLTLVHACSRSCW
jgi:DNA-binding winged helix-turn-helix (wHTH) protein